MTTRPEVVLYSSLIDVDRLEYLAQEGLNTEIIPTGTMRPVVEWAIDYFYDSGCTQAPSMEALRLEWGSVLDVEDITLDEPDEETETIQWAVEWLKSHHLYLEWQRLYKSGAEKMAGAYTEQRIDVLTEHIGELAALHNTVKSKRNELSGVSAFEDAIRRYEIRQAMEGQPQGLLFGLEHLDQHLHGVHPGELAVLAAGPKTGKSMVLARTALHEWMRERRALLFTLENSVEMTLDRMVCMHCGIDFRQWQRGLCTPAQVEQVRQVIDTVKGLMGDLMVVMPPKGARTVEAMVREAQSRGAESLLIDQLTFVEALRTSRMDRHEVVRDIMHDLKASISSGSYRPGCVLAHQINREGVKAVQKTGHLEMYMLAESAEVERTADHVLGLYRSREHEMGRLATLQILASRREEVTAWMMAFDPAQGLMRTLREITLGGES